MLKKILSIATCGALALASFCATFFSLKAIRANASEAEVLLYTLDFTDIPRTYLDPHHANSVSGLNPDFSEWEEMKLNELKARGFTMGDEFNLGGHDSKFFYQTTPYSYYNGWSNDYEYLDPYAFFLKFEGGTSFEKVLENETRIKIYVDPVEYYYHGAIDFVNSDEQNYFLNVSGYDDILGEVQTRTEAVSLKINDVVVGDNVTGVIEQDLSGYDDIKITQDLKGVTVYKIEFYGLPETKNPLKPDDGASDTVIDDKLLYTYDFTDVDEKYLEPITMNGCTYPAVSSNEAHAGFSELEAIWREKIESDGWVLGAKFNIFDHSSSDFYQTIPGSIFNAEIRDPYAFGLKSESSTSFTKARQNETRIKIYIDPVSYYYSGNLSFADLTEHYELQTRTYEKNLKCSGQPIKDNLTGVIEYDVSNVDIISITQGATGIFDRAYNIYKIEVYGVEEPAPAPTVESGLDKFFTKIGLPGLALGTQIAIIVGGVIIIRKILK